MIIMIICAVVTAAVVFYMFCNDFGWEMWFSNLLVSLISSIGGGGIGILLALALPAETEPRITTYQIEALQDNSSISGQFFLGSGSVNGNMAYTFYYEVNGMYRIEQVNCDRAFIKYTTGEPKVEVHSVKLTDSLINLFAFDCIPQKEYIFYVPKGTIKQGYRLDAQ